MKQNLVLGFCSNYRYDDVKPFIASFFSANVDAKLCLYCSGMDERFHEVARDQEIILLDAAPYLDRKYHAQNVRFFMYDDHLKQVGSEYENIMLCDIRDVFFQGDPFKMPLKREVCFAAEDGPIRPNPYNSNWIKEIYGDDVYEEIADNWISCSGTTIGTASGMKAYVTLMCQEISGRDYDHSRPNDQGMHNYIAWKLQPSFIYVDVADLIFNTIGMTRPENIVIENGLVSANNKISPVIHQWDRHQAVGDFVLTSPKFQLEGVKKRGVGTTSVLDEPGTLSIGEITRLTVGRHGRFLNFASDGISQMIARYGEWAEPEVALLCSIVQTGDVVIDVGANLGTLTVPLAKAAGTTGKVIAFEAQPTVHKLLCANIILNELFNVTALNVALGDQQGYLHIPQIDYRAPGNYGGMSFAGTTIDPNDGDSMILCQKLDSMTAHLSSCRLIKIDVEGMEGAVLSGGEAFVSRTRPIIYCEANRAEIFDKIADFCQRLGYTQYWHCFPGFNLNNFFEIKDKAGPLGDANLLCVPNEQEQCFSLPLAREFREVFELYPGLLS